MSDPLDSFVRFRTSFTGNDNDTSIVDDKGHPVSAYGGAKVSTEQFKEKPSSLECGPLGYIESPYSTDWNIGTGAFCVEAWVKFDHFLTTFPFRQSIYSRTTPTYGVNKELDIGIHTNNNIYLYYEVRGQWETFRFFPVQTLSLNTWHHIAVSRDITGVMRAFLDGKLSTTIYTDAVELNNPQAGIRFGKWAADQNHKGPAYIDFARLTIGHPRYTAPFSISIDLITIKPRKKDPKTEEEIRKTLQYAIRNKLVVNFSYNKQTRIVEPHICGQALTTRWEALGWERKNKNNKKQEETGWKRYYLKEMQNLTVTTTEFKPRQTKTHKRWLRIETSAVKIT